MAIGVHTPPEGSLDSMRYVTGVDNLVPVGSVSGRHDNNAESAQMLEMIGSLCGSARTERRMSPHYNFLNVASVT